MPTSWGISGGIGGSLCDTQPLVMMPDKLRKTKKRMEFNIIAKVVKVVSLIPLLWRGVP
jgi:hypothetical protein